MLSILGTIMLSLFAIELTIGILITIYLKKWGVYGDSN